MGLKLVIFQGPTLNFNLLNQEIGTCPNLCRIVSLDRGLDHDPTIFHADLLGLCCSALLTILSLVEAACLFVSTPTPYSYPNPACKGLGFCLQGEKLALDCDGCSCRLSGNTVSSRESFCHMASYICSSLRGLNVLYWRLPPQALSVLSPVEVSPTPGSLIIASLLFGPMSYFQHPMLLKSPLTWRQAHLRHDRSPHMNEFPVFQSLAIFQQDTILKC